MNRILVGPLEVLLVVCTVGYRDECKAAAITIIIVRTIHQSAGHRLAVKKVDGLGIMHSLMPNQVLFVSKGGKVPRLLLGREALALQGFPIEVLDIMDPDGTLWSEATLHDLAVNMLSAPVMLCDVMVAIEAVSYTHLTLPTICSV